MDNRGSMYNEWGFAELEIKSQHRSSRTPIDLRYIFLLRMDDLSDNVTGKEPMGVQERHDTAIPSCLGLLNVILSHTLERA